MGHKRSKRDRKTLSFFKVNYNIDSPYKILLDASFIDYVIKHKIDLSVSFSKLFDGPYYFHVTPCIISHLHRLCDNRAAVALFLKIAKKFYCSHTSHSSQQNIPLQTGKKRTSSVKCIMSILDKNNPQHFFIAAEQLEVLQKCRSVPGVPVVSVNNTLIYLEDPSRTSKDLVESNAHAKMGLRQDEKQVIEALKNKDDVPELPKRKKKARGPNPLSVKKKIIKTTDRVSKNNAVVVASQKSTKIQLESEASAGSVVEKRKHKRRRRKKNKEA